MKTKIWLPLLLGAMVYLSLVSIPQQALKGERSPITMTPADVGLDYEDVSLQPADLPLDLEGWWMPAVDSAATLVFIHGGGSNRHSSYFSALEFYAAMVERGISVFAIDLRNHGNSGSDDRGLQFGLGEQADAAAAVRWARDSNPGQAVYAMGISMGGATVIHAAAAGAPVDGLVLLDPLLDTHATFAAGGWAESGIPPALFAPAAWAATTFYGLPSGPEQALEVAAALELPMLLIQDPDDPVTQAQYAQALAARNDSVQLWLAPPVDSGHPDLAWKGRWGSHVAAFHMFPDQTVARILAFMGYTR